MKLKFKSGKPKAEKQPKPKKVKPPKARKVKPPKEAKSLKSLSKAMRSKKDDVRRDAAQELRALLERPWAELNVAEKKIGETTYPVVSDCRVFCAIINVLGSGALRFPLKNYKFIADSAACCYAGIAKPDNTISSGRVVCAGCGADFTDVKCAAESDELYYSPVGSAIHCYKCNCDEGLYVIGKKEEAAV